jgi:hypothetical protein
MIDVRDPHITVRALIGPAAAVGELSFIGAQFFGKVAAPHRPGQKSVPAAVPVGKGILVPGRHPRRPEDKPPLGSDHTLQGMHHLGRVLSRRFHGTLDDPQLRLSALSCADAIQPCLQDIERGVLGMQLETLGLNQIGDAQKYLSALEMQLHEIQVPGGQLDDIHLRVPVHPQVVLFPEMDREPPFPGAQHVAADHGQIHGAGF